MSYNGFSSYPDDAYDGMDAIIAGMVANSVKTLRIPFNPIDVAGSRPYVKGYVDYFLAETPADWLIIVDGNHYYETVPNDANVITRCLDICDSWAADRTLVELVNEPPWGWPFYSKCQTYIDAIRDAGYSHRIVTNKFSPYFDQPLSDFYEPWDVFDDPLDKTWQGIHIYLSQYPPEPGGGTGGYSYQDLLLAALEVTEKLIITEAGAESDEIPFSQEHVDETNDYLAWCGARNIYNNIWLRIDDVNLVGVNGYDDLGGLTFPEPPDEGSYPSTVSLGTLRPWGHNE